MHGEPWSVLCCGTAPHRRDSAFNVALGVHDVSAVVERAVRAGGRVVQSPVHVYDVEARGGVEYAVVAPPVDGYLHTLVDTSQYTGVFLPGFHSVCYTQQQRIERYSVFDSTVVVDSDSANPQYMDHVAIACGRGQGAMLQRWYEEVLGAHRFRLNTADTQHTGLQFGGCVQMALRALRYHVNDSVSTQFNDTASVHTNGPAPAQVHDSSTAQVNDSSARVNGSSTARVNDSLTARVYDSSTARVNDSSTAQVNDSSTAQVNDSSSAQVNGSSTAQVNDPANVNEPELIQEREPVSDFDYSSSLKLVLAESLDDSSHVAAFLRAHGSPGVQHVGLHSAAALRAVRRLVTHGGAQLRVPPSGYYRRPSVKRLMAAVGLSAEEQQECRELGLLVDDEADVDAKLPLSKQRYLMQVFTRPIFAESTFFLEVIERRGARGFGQGNIEALASSIVQQMEGEKTEMGEEKEGDVGDDDELDREQLDLENILNKSRKTNSEKLRQKSR